MRLNITIEKFNERKERAYRILRCELFFRLGMGAKESSKAALNYMYLNVWESAPKVHVFRNRTTSELMHIDEREVLRKIRGKS